MHEYESGSDKSWDYNSLPNDRILDWVKLKGFEDDKFDTTKLMKSVCDKIENIEGKRRKYWLPAFSPFPSRFSKGFYVRVVLKVR